MFRKPYPSKHFRRGYSLTTPIMNLPNELLAEIASYCAIRHPSSDDHYVINSQALVALCQVSRTLRANSLPLLYKDVVLISERQLRALARAPHHVLNLVQELNIFLTPDFFASLKTFAARPSNGSTQPLSSSPYISLLSILHSTPHIAALRIRVAESTGPNSAWTRSSFLQRPDGIPIGDVLRPLLSHSSHPPLNPRSPPTTRLQLPHLRRLELDAFSDIAPLLRLAPNLQHLVMNLPHGYAQYTNVQILEALRHVPRLKTLRYSAQSLSLKARTEDSDSDSEVESDPETAGPGAGHAVPQNHHPHHIEDDTSAELIRAIGRLLPRLESLDLHSCSYEEHQMQFPVFSDAITPEALIEATSHFRNLKHLVLPTCTITRKEYLILRSSTPTLISMVPSQPRSRSGSLATPSSNSDDIHYQALQRAASTEKAVIIKLGSLPQLRTLRTVSFIRPANWNDQHESMVQYQIRVVYSNFPSPKAASHPRVDLISHDVLAASTLHFDVLPHPSSHSHRWSKRSLKKWQSAALQYAKENQVASVVAAGAGGILLSEATRAIYAHATSP